MNPQKICGPDTTVELIFKPPLMHATIEEGGFINTFLLGIGGNKVKFSTPEKKFIGNVRYESDTKYYDFEIANDCIDIFTKQIKILVEIETCIMSIINHLDSTYRPILPPNSISDPVLDGDCFQVYNKSNMQSVCIHYGLWGKAPVYLQGIDTTPFEADHDVEYVENDIFSIWFNLPREFDLMKDTIDKAIRLSFQL
jgi:hypothetical protein